MSNPRPAHQAPKSKQTPPAPQKSDQPVGHYAPPRMRFQRAADGGRDGRMEGCVRPESPPPFPKNSREKQIGSSKLLLRAVQQQVCKDDCHHRRVLRIATVQLHIVQHLQPMQHSPDPSTQKLLGAMSRKRASLFARNICNSLANFGHRRATPKPPCFWRAQHQTFRCLLCYPCNVGIS